MKKIISAVFIFLSCIMVVKAEDSCTYQEELELREKASNIKVSYDAKTRVGENGLEDTAPQIINYFDVSLTNILNEFYVVVTNDVNDKETLLNNNENGISTFEWTDLDKVATLTFKVVASSRSKCSGLNLKTFTYKLPRINKYYSTLVCVNEFPNHELCQKFVTFNDMDINKFYDTMDKYREKVKEDKKEEDKNFFEKLLEFLNKNKWIILGVIVVSAGGGYTYYYFKTKKQRDLGL